MEMPGNNDYDRVEDMVVCACERLAFASTHNHVFNTIVALIICVLIFLFSFSTASAHTFAGNGRIFGQLLNGTKNNTPIASQTVTLQLAQGNTAQDFATATTDAQGAYSFDNLQTDKTISYAVYIRYQGTQYVSDVVTLNSNLAPQLNLTVYQSTQRTDNIAIIDATVLVHELNQQKGTITVSEFFEFMNLNN